MSLVITLNMGISCYVVILSQAFGEPIRTWLSRYVPKWQLIQNTCWTIWSNQTEQYSNQYEQSSNQQDQVSDQYEQVSDQVAQVSDQYEQLRILFR